MDILPDQELLAGPTRSLKVLSANHPGKPADYCDSLSSDKEKDINNYLNSSGGKSSGIEACVQDNTLVTGDFGGSRWNLRKTQNFVIMQWYQHEKVLGYCYCFKKLR